MIRKLIGASGATRHEATHRARPHKIFLVVFHRAFGSRIADADDISPVRSFKTTMSFKKLFGSDALTQRNNFASRKCDKQSGFKSNRDNTATDRLSALRSLIQSDYIY